MKHLIIVATSLLISACANTAKILDSDQRKVVSDDSKYVHDQLPNIYAQIAKANSLGALIAVPDNRTSAPPIATGESPAAALLAHPEFNPPREKICYFIYSESISVEPIRTPCGVYLNQAKQFSNFAKAIADQKKLADENSAEMQHLEEGQAAVGSVLNPLLSASKLNTEQIELLQQQVNVIAGAFDQSVDMQKKTSDVLQQTLGTLDNNNQELNKKLDELSTKLGTLK
jgi:hypothetical protein